MGIFNILSVCRTIAEQECTKGTGQEPFSAKVAGPAIALEN
jgi:hypothetical protein